MVTPSQPTSSRPESDDAAVSVEPVAALPPAPSRAAARLRLERGCRLLLAARVATLERELERVRRRHERAVEHYEQLLAEREGDEVAFSWQ